MLIGFLPICNLFSAASVHLFLWTGGKGRLFYSVTKKKKKKRPLVKDKTEERTGLLLGGCRSERAACGYLADTRRPLDKFRTSSKPVQASLSPHRLEGTARGLNQTPPAAEQRQREAL